MVGHALVKRQSSKYLLYFSRNIVNSRKPACEADRYVNPCDFKTNRNFQTLERDINTVWTPPKRQGLGAG
jgi:hypothetical protein